MSPFLLLCALADPAGAADAPVPADTLTFETWNVGLAHGFVDHASDRLSGIADALSRSEADVICLQEAWTARDRSALLAATPDWTERYLEPITQLRASVSPVCKRADLFGEDRFVSCLTGTCGDLSGDDKTDCVIENCGPVLETLRDDNAECATALMAQVGKSSLGALWAVRSPFCKAGLFAYEGSDGLMLLSKVPLNEPSTLDFSDVSTLNRRRALLATVDVGDQPVRVACTHLTADLSSVAPYPGASGSWGEENALQVDGLVAALGEGPAVVLGDFNCGVADPDHDLAGELEDSCRTMDAAGFADPVRQQFPTCTWCADNTLNESGEGEHENSLIDHIYTRGVAPVTGGRRYDGRMEIETKAGPTASSLSDHYGVSLTVRAGTPQETPTAVEAAAFAGQVEAELRHQMVQSARAAWAYETDINEVHEAAMVGAESERMAWLTENMPKAAVYLQAPGLDPVVARQLQILTTHSTLPAPVDATERTRLAEVAARLGGMYGAGKACDDAGENCRDLTALSNVLAAGGDWDAQLEAWADWRTVSPAMQPLYAELVGLGNQGAQDLGYDNLAELWLSQYDMEPAAVEAEVDRLWEQVKPLYEELHCYTRMRLAETYGRDKVDQKGLLPAHATGNMWAQSWEGLYPLLEPHPGALGLDVTQALKDQEWDPTKMVKTGEAFFTSMGLDPMPETFWERSMFTKPEGKDVVCHASAWDVDLTNDQRIKMCIQPTLDELVTIHHELGHNYYNQYYTTLPVLFQNSAHDGFHEAIGDAVALSITPGYLQNLGLIEVAEETPEAVLNKQMLDALQKVAFLPFGRVVDQWRWDVFRGEVPEEDWNAHWWSLRAQYQGVGPTGPRPEGAFDPGAKYHIPANTPYLRYFFAAVLQFQLHEALCEAAGHEGPLHTCSVYGSEAAGDKLAALLSMGSSQPWPDALEAMAGTRQMDAGPLLSYFAPLRGYLAEQNKRQTCGWK